MQELTTNEELSKKLEVVDELLLTQSNISGNIYTAADTIRTALDALFKYSSSYTSSYHKYLEDLGKVSLDTKPIPMDTFPGLAATGLSADEIQKNAVLQAEMKTLAQQIKESNNQINYYSSSLINQLKHVLGQVQEYLNSQDAIKDQLKEILEDMNSVYDVGFLKRNS